MEKNKKCSAACINLEFIPSQSVSRQEKIRDFWKYLDSQVDLKPYEVPKEEYEEEEVKQSKKSPTVSPSAAAAKSPKVRAKPSPTNSGARPKQNSKGVKEKKRDKESCSLEKYLRQDLIYADAVEVPYEELYAEIEAYHKRLQRCGCKNEKCDCKRDA